MSGTNVYVIEASVAGYHNQVIFRAVYADRHTAEARAAELRCEIAPNDDPCDDGELVYVEVQVNAVTLN